MTFCGGSDRFLYLKTQKRNLRHCRLFLAKWYGSGLRQRGTGSSIKAGGQISTGGWPWRLPARGHEGSPQRKKQPLNPQMCPQIRICGHKPRGLVRLMAAAPHSAGSFGRPRWWDGAHRNPHQNINIHLKYKRLNIYLQNNRYLYLPKY